MAFRLSGVLRVVGMVCLLLGLTVSVAHAQDPVREQAFVYGISNFNGAKYASALVPPAVDTIYLLGSRENVLAPRQTLVYFWPITNEYLADWDQRNELVEGSLEVLRNGQLFSTITLSPYVIQYDTNDPDNTLAMYTGSEAEAKHAAWQAALNQYQDALVTFYRAQGDWDAQIAKLRQDSPDGVIPPEKVPPRPEQPQRPSILSTSPAQGYVVNLPVGTYEIQVRHADGTIQPDSKKRLVVFDKQRDGIAYSVVPSIRWNLPEQSDEPDSVVYALPGTTLYFQAFKAGQFNDYEYAHMLNPQDQSSQPDRGKWVSFDPETKLTMRVTGGGQARQIQSQPYLVRQVSGGGLGYEVALFDPKTMDRSTFDGYTIPLNTAGEEYTIELVDAGGVPVAGSQRRVIALNADRSPTPYVLTALPLVVGAGVLLFRRRRARKIQVDA